MRHKSRKKWKTPGDELVAARAVALALAPLSRPGRQRVCSAIAAVLQAELILPGVVSVFQGTGLDSVPLDILNQPLSGTHEIREDPDFDR